ncbi:MAG: HAD family hydrolase [Candidatus Heteroscillospira sp.]|jgi:FMN phosphatase YigB (HAD superfamily)
MLDTILFDLDGTLLPFSEKEFVGVYFPGMAKKLAPYGVEAEPLIKALWDGTRAMVKNDGGATNREVFWKRFQELMGAGVRKLEPVTNDFYCCEFNDARAVLREERDCAPMIAGLRDKGYTVALATNPIFPLCGVETRLRWINLKLEDFALVTSYENCCATKPNPAYFSAVLEKLGKKPEQCLMIGNNCVEDAAAMELGIPVILVTDTPEGAGEVPAEAKTMSFAEIKSWLDGLPAIK